ncbi:heat shock protein GrpE [Alkalihalobacillus alcalophilus ATCC 27647 = CGMCC 1.3604]|uniref:Protein GrpE n=1 Tax=Alkalihalobacillus alcalophilus ATCC 27647 = CGMCC 1.3604 TaxID=1218173 RepID=A0A094WQY2_ALKAL|nr:nucleotide exchange factor GrpE [Alkalihalobacillus alcalophilus]KGA98453.1 protein GrpE [Alkalihalobacillus alcalophilus ATCC 27647 = CGMCC 1.3604]MED1563335.1 nucleotide exchange factor GrpE [Alkalihalobacillus alcalophilus]THG88523.1 heat shock protein GrpE [Alkalihalobacillus alcalophilus ATCC 27647 = CGMCC 1.3604]
MNKNEAKDMETMTEQDENQPEKLTEETENDEFVDEVVEANEEEENSRENELEAQLAEANQRILRVQADYDNFRRRSREEKEAAAKYRSQSIIESLLPVLDNFERALVVEPESEETKSLLTGMDMVYRQLQDALKNEGVELIPTVGETFDPHRHQAVMQVEEEGYESNQIVEELQKGYQLKDRVIRPSMVKVNA